MEESLFLLLESNAELCLLAFILLSCCAERYESWILSDPLAFLWQVIAAIHASEPLHALGKICISFRLDITYASQPFPC